MAHDILKVVRRAHAALIFVLTLAGLGLAAVFVWAATVRGGLCSQYDPRVWIYGGLAAFAVAIVGGAFVGTLIVDDSPTLQRVYIAVALVEAAAAVALAIYLASKERYAFWCG